VTDGSVATYRLVLEAVCGLVVPDLDRDHIPHHAEGRDPDDDPIIETALRGGAIAVVSDDRSHIALSENGGTPYRDSGTGHITEAFLPSVFIERYVEGSGFSLDDIDGALLELAVGSPPTA
jgi:hypothetical protein